MINFFSEDTDFVLKGKRLTGLKIKQLIADENRCPGEISFVFCSDNYLLQLNNQYLNHDYLTDVITFDYSENDRINGEIYISIDSVKENALQFGVSFENELNRVMYHGILHLCGYKDKTPEEETLMRAKENHYLAIL